MLSFRGVFPLDEEAPESRLVIKGGSEGFLCLSCSAIASMRLAISGLQHWVSGIIGFKAGVGSTLTCSWLHLHYQTTRFLAMIDKT